MSKPNIHPTAIVEEGAVLDDHVIVEPYAIVKKNVTLKKGVVIKSHAYIDGYTTVGAGTTIYPFACIGSRTQDKKFRGEKTFVTIGQNCDIREYVTINSSCGEGTTVSVGDRCLIMAYCHLAHHCQIGNDVTMANGSMLAGHVTIEDHVNIGGMTAVHQFVRIGAHSMVGGQSGLVHDVPPYTVGYGSRKVRIGGLNLVGLRRRKFKREDIRLLNEAYKLTYRSGLPLEQALDRIESELDPVPVIVHWIQFARGSMRGLSGLGLEEAAPEEILSKPDIVSC